MIGYVFLPHLSVRLTVDARCGTVKQNIYLICSEISK